MRLRPSILKNHLNALSVGRLLVVFWLLNALLAVSFVEQEANAAGLNALPWANLKPDGYAPGELIVKMRGATPGKNQIVSATAFQKPDVLLSDTYMKPFGAYSYLPLNGLPGYYILKTSTKADMSRMVAAALLNPAVEYAEPNLYMTPSRAPSDRLYGQAKDDGNEQYRQWYLKRIGVEAFWDVNTGNNQVIAIVDTGINVYHEDLKDKVIKDRAYDFTRSAPVGQYAIQTDLWDDDGHGTALAGIIAAKTNSDIGTSPCSTSGKIIDACTIAGINWDSRPNLLSVKVAKTDPNRVGYTTATTSAVAQGIIYATDNQARIINVSLNLVPETSEKPSKLLEDAATYANKFGALIVASAGNTVETRPDFPSNFSNVIVVAATNKADKVISSPSSQISVAAPGEDIFTTTCFFSGARYTGENPPESIAKYISQGCANPNPTKYPWAGIKNVDCSNIDFTSCYHGPVESMYAYVTGSSYSAAIVTGLVSLMVSYDTNISNAEIKNILESTTDDIEAPGKDIRSGFGRVNAAKIIEALQTDRTKNRNTILQGIITGANPGDVLINLSPSNINQAPNGINYRYDGLTGGTVYSLRVSVPKRGVVLGPVLLYPTGTAGEIINVNFDIAASSIVCGARATCPGSNVPGPQPPPVLPTNPLAPNGAFFLPAAPLPGARFFAETSHNLSGSFRDYWDRNGGLAVFGYPISEEFSEVSQTDGRTYIVQYFERNRYEFHPENDAANRVLLGLLGSELTRDRIFAPGAPVPNTSDQQYFPETSHTLSGRFYNYWRNNGGLAIFGYPISEPIEEGGFLVQYFERNRFEYHPENAGSRFEVLLGRLGVDLARGRNYVR